MSVGPGSAVEARVWVHEAVETGRYRVSAHFLRRMEERQIGWLDVRRVLRRPRLVEPYPAMPVEAGTLWRFIGRGVSGPRAIAVGLEAYLDERGWSAALMTVIDLGRME